MLNSGLLKIKVCGIKFRENIEEIIRLQPDYLGFIFYPQSPRCMKDTLLPEDLKNISVKKVGVFVNPTHEEVESAIKNFYLDTIQLHGDESSEFCELIKNKNVEVIKVFPVDDDFDFQITKGYKGCCDYFLFDTKGNNSGGNGITFNWDILKNYNLEIPFFLSGGIGPENIQQVIELKNPKMHGIDINSKVEHSPGLKDVNKVKQTISILKNTEL